MLRIGALVSGGGTNLQAIMDAIDSGLIPDAKIEIVISNKQNAYALERALQAGISSTVVSHKNYTDGAHFDEA